MLVLLLGAAGGLVKSESSVGEVGSGSLQGPLAESRVGCAFVHPPCHVCGGGLPGLSVCLAPPVAFASGVKWPCPFQSAQTVATLASSVSLAASD